MTDMMDQFLCLPHCPAHNTPPSLQGMQALELPTPYAASSPTEIAQALGQWVAASQRPTIRAVLGSKQTPVLRWLGECLPFNFH